MDLSMLLASAVVLVVVSTSVMALLRWIWPDAGAKRLSAGEAPAHAGVSALPAKSAFERLYERLPERMRQFLVRLSRWSLPGPVDATAPQEADALPLQLLRAGWRSPHALWLLGASKTLLSLLGFTLGATISWLQGRVWLGPGWWLWCLGLAAAGYLLPTLWLRWSTRRRQQALFRAFPDALDMLRICVQAGLGLDAAIERVGREMQLSSPILSEEWRLTGLELRAGASRRVALQHLAERVGLREIDAMVTMLIQADRFGTRMSEALKVHAEVLRTQRKQQAEAAAAQLPVKLLIPLIFCVFPALLTVMLGPVGLSLHAHFSRQG